MQTAAEIKQATIGLVQLFKNIVGDAYVFADEENLQ